MQVWPFLPATRRTFPVCVAGLEKASRVCGADRACRAKAAAVATRCRAIGGDQSFNPAPAAAEGEPTRATLSERPELRSRLEDRQ